MTPTETLLGGPLDGLAVIQTTLTIVHAHQQGDEKIHVYHRWVEDERLHFLYSKKPDPIAKQGYRTSP